MRIKVRENQAEEIEGLTTEYPYAYHHADLADTKVPWHCTKSWNLTIL